MTWLSAAATGFAERASIASPSPHHDGANIRVAWLVAGSGFDPVVDRHDLLGNSSEHLERAVTWHTWARSLLKVVGDSESLRGSAAHDWSNPHHVTCQLRPTKRSDKNT